MSFPYFASLSLFFVALGFALWTIFMTWDLLKMRFKIAWLVALGWPFIITSGLWVLRAANPTSYDPNPLAVIPAWAASWYVPLSYPPQIDWIWFASMLIASFVTLNAERVKQILRLFSSL